MQILIGVASGLLFFSFLVCAAYAGYQFGIRTKPNEKPGPSSEEKERMKRRQKEFQSMMNYTVQQAMGVKHE